MKGKLRCWLLSEEGEAGVGRAVWAGRASGRTCASAGLPQREGEREREKERERERKREKSSSAQVWVF